MPDVGGQLETIAAAVGVFVGTDIDDLIVLTVLFLSARATGKPRPWQIWAGQYAGIGVLVIVSAIAALGLTIVPDQWMGLLGLVPFALGVKGIVMAIRTRDHDQPPAPAVATGLLSVVGVTIANGADNISVYTPLFRTIGLTNSLLTAGVFAGGIAAWCLAGSWLGSHKKIIEVIHRFGHWIVPNVFMLIGAVIIIKSGVLGALSTYEHDRHPRGEITNPASARTYSLAVPSSWPPTSPRRRCPGWPKATACGAQRPNDIAGAT